MTSKDRSSMSQTMHSVTTNQLNLQLYWPVTGHGPDGSPLMQRFLKEIVGQEDAQTGQPLPCYTTEYITLQSNDNDNGAEDMGIFGSKKKAVD